MEPDRPGGATAQGPWRSSAPVCRRGLQRSRMKVTDALLVLLHNVGVLPGCWHSTATLFREGRGAVWLCATVMTRALSPAVDSA